MSRARAAILLVVVFALGGVCGALATATWVRAHRPAGFGPRAGRAEALAIRRITRRLELDEAQRRVLERIAEDTRRRMDAVRDDARLRVEEILAGALDDLVPELRDDQKAKLMQMREERRRRGHRRGGPPDSGRGHGRRRG